LTAEEVHNLAKNIRSLSKENLMGILKIMNSSQGVAGTKTENK
jgi:hypothetical protein